MEGKTGPFKIILGSSSIARRNILSEMGYEFTLMSADIDEKSIRKEKPVELVMALAEAKADSIVLKLQSISNHEKDEMPTILIAADTVVVYEDVVREKPANEKEAREFIRGYSGGHCATVGSVIVTNIKTGVRKGEWDRVELSLSNYRDLHQSMVATKRASKAHEIVMKNVFRPSLHVMSSYPYVPKGIYFHKIPDEIIDKLIEEGAVLHVAGALIIEHPLIMPYVKQVVGTTDSVMGLPKSLTEKLIKEVL